MVWWGRREIWREGESVRGGWEEGESEAQDPITSVERVCRAAYLYVYIHTTLHC